MFSTLRTLIRGASASAEEQLRDIYAVDLIEQSIRDVDAQLDAAKTTLATLIQRHRAEAKLLTTAETKIADMTARATSALKAGDEALAHTAAQAIADMEREVAQRQDRVASLDHQITRLRVSVEAGQRKIVALRHGAAQARATRQEAQAHRRLRGAATPNAAIKEAEDLIARVLNQDDPFEAAEIRDEIERDLSHDTLADRMAAAGHGDPTRPTAASVLARLKDNL